MKVTNHLDPEIFGILESAQTSVYIKLKTEVCFAFFLLEKIHDGVLQTHKPCNESHGI